MTNTQKLIEEATETIFSFVDGIDAYNWGQDKFKEDIRLAFKQVAEAAKAEEREKMDKLIYIQDEFIWFLEQKLENVNIFAHHHGWKGGDEAKALLMRRHIAQVKALLSNQK